MKAATRICAASMALSAVFFSVGLRGNEAAEVKHPKRGAPKKPGAVKPTFVRYIQQQPKFDCRVDDSHFAINIERNDFFFRTDANNMLKAGTQLLRTRAEENAFKLRAETTAKTSAMSTVQRNVSSGFHLNLANMVPRIAPTLAKELGAQIDRARLQPQLAKADENALKAAAAKQNAPSAALAAALPRNEHIPNLAPEHAAPHAVQVETLALPPFVRHPVPTAQPTAPSIQSGGVSAFNRQPNSSGQPQIASARVGTESPAHANAGLGGGNGGETPPLQTNGNAPAPISPAAVAMATGHPAAASIHAPSAVPVPDVSAKLASPNAVPSVRVPDVSARIASPNAVPSIRVPNVSTRITSANTVAAGGAPNISARIASASAVPGIGVPDVSAGISIPNASASLVPSIVKPNTSAHAQLDSASHHSIDWTPWHKRFAALARQPLQQAVNDIGSPLAQNSVQITVYRDHTLQVALATTSNNPKFDQAVVAVYQRLSGNPALAYPSGSLRASVTFLVDTKHLANDAISVVNSKTIADSEIVR